MHQTDNNNNTGLHTSEISSFPEGSNHPISVSNASTIENVSSQKDSVDMAYDMVTMVDSLLGQLSHKFDTISEEIFSKINKMTEQLDGLEAMLNEMLAENRPDKCG